MQKIEKPDYKKRLPTNRDFVNINNIFSALLGKNEIFVKGGMNASYVPGGNAFQHCPSQLCMNSQMPKARHKRGWFAEKKLSDFRDAMEWGDITDNDIKRAMKIYSQKCGYLYPEDDEGNIKCVPMNVKGTARYNKKQQSKIIDACAYYYRLGWQMFGLTLTYDVEKHGWDLLEGWKTYREQVDAVTKTLEKRYDSRAVVVLESTKKGRPHAHIMLFFPPKTFKLYEKIHKTTELKFGSLYRFIKARVQSPVFNLQAIVGKNAMFYCTKYITKTDSLDLVDACKIEDNLKSSDRKACLGLLCSVCAGIRLFSLPKLPPEAFGTQEYRDAHSDKAPLSQREERKRDNGFISWVQSLPLEMRWDGAVLARLRALLIKLSIKCAPKTKNRIWFGQGKPYEKFVKQKTAVLSGFDVDLQRYLATEAKELWHNVSFYDFLLEFLSTGSNWYFNAFFERTPHEGMGQLKPSKNDCDDIAHWFKVVLNCIEWTVVNAGTGGILFSRLCTLVRQGRHLDVDSPVKLWFDDRQEESND